MIQVLDLAQDTCLVDIRHRLADTGEHYVEIDS